MMNRDKRQPLALLIAGLVASASLYYLWFSLVRFLDQPRPWPVIAQEAKAATAVVSDQMATAFCVHESGYFVTSSHAIPLFNTSVRLVLNPGSSEEREGPAEVVAVDSDRDLALLRLPDKTGMPFLTLGNAKGLDQQTELMIVGLVGSLANPRAPIRFPPLRDELHHVIVSQGAEQEGLERVRFDEAIDAGFTGGPVLDDRGRVVGAVANPPSGPTPPPEATPGRFRQVVGAVANPSGGPGRKGIERAIPTSDIQDFLTRPVIVFTPPEVSSGRETTALEFVARVYPLVPSDATYDVELVLGPAESARTIPMTSKGGLFHAKAPLISSTGPAQLRASVEFDDGSATGVLPNGELTVGAERLWLNQVSSLRLGDPAQATLWDGRTITGQISAPALVLRFGKQSFPIPISSGTLSFESPEPTDAVPCRIVARRRGKEVGVRNIPVFLHGAEEQSWKATRDGHFSRPLRSPLPVDSILVAKDEEHPDREAKSIGLHEQTMSAELRGDGAISVISGHYNCVFAATNGQTLGVGELRHASEPGSAAISLTIHIVKDRSVFPEGANDVMVWELECQGQKVLRLALDFTTRGQKSKELTYGRIRFHSSFY